jgi:hypothetical protein
MEVFAAPGQAPNAVTMDEADSKGKNMTVSSNLG